MRIPSRSYQLEGLLDCPPAEFSMQVAQDHLLKHPFGLGALYGKVRSVSSHEPRPRVWNAEQWDRTSPPVLTAGERRELTEAIRGLSVEGARCGAAQLEHESFRGDAPRVLRPCMVCPEPLVATCARTTEGPRERYLALVDELLNEVRRGSAVVVPRVELMPQVCTATPAELAKLVVLSAGMLGSSDKPGVRISRGDGLRIELYGERTLRWRTLYRSAVPRATMQKTFLLQLLAEDGLTSRTMLSGKCVVGRLGWQGVSAHVS